MWCINLFTVTFTREQHEKMQGGGVPRHARTNDGKDRLWSSCTSCQFLSRQRAQATHFKWADGRSPADAWLREPPLPTWLTLQTAAGASGFAGCSNGTDDQKEPHFCRDTWRITRRVWRRAFPSPVDFFSLLFWHTVLNWHVMLDWSLNWIALCVLISSVNRRDVVVAARSLKHVFLCSYFLTWSKVGARLSMSCWSCSPLSEKEQACCGGFCQQFLD